MSARSRAQPWFRSPIDSTSAAELAEALRIAALANRLSATYGPAIALGLLQGRVSAFAMSGIVKSLI